VPEEACNCDGESPNECPDDGMKGTDEVCVGGCLCASIPNLQWCQDDDDCWTDLSSLPGLCINNACQVMGSPSHECMGDGSNPFECEDGNPCTMHWCSMSDECVYGLVPPGGTSECCIIDADCHVCADDGERYCGADNQCVDIISD
jgi:hypothetical protein